MRLEDGRQRKPPVCGDRGSGSRCGGGGRRSRPKMASLLISVLDRNMAPTVGPLLCTLVRLCVDPIDPSRDVAVRVSFDLRYDEYDNGDDDDDDDHDDGNESGGGRHRSLLSSLSTEDPDPSEEDRDNDTGIQRQQRLRRRRNRFRLCRKCLARDLSHDVHMMVRNSMGSALFLDLTVTLPLGWGSGSGSDICTGSDAPSPEEVEREAECAEWRYLTVILRERDQRSRRRCCTPPTL